MVSFTAGRIANTGLGSHGRAPATARHRLPIGALELYTPRAQRTLSSVSRLRRATKGTSTGRASLHSASTKH